jgi:hypothetical protein
MRYPILSSVDASTCISAKRNGSPVDADRLVKTRGDGQELRLEFVEDVRRGLRIVSEKFPDGLTNQKLRNRFEAEAARVVHEGAPQYPELLADPDFWTWLAVIHLGHVVEWRYGNPEGGTPLANYGVGARNENLLFRLWLRAELVLDEQARDRYYLCGAGQIDFYRSHLIRQSYANARNFARALLRFQYPHDDEQPKLKVNQIRDLVKRLRRLRANLFIEILDEGECRKVIETEAEVIAASA